MAWQGWGAGPAGAAARAPSRVFLTLALVAALVVAGILFRDGKPWEGGVTVAAAVYFALRLLGVIGGGRAA